MSNSICPTILLFNINELSHKDCIRLKETFLNQSEKKKMDNFYFFGDSKRFLMGRVLVKIFFCLQSKIHPREIIFSKTKFGKPYYFMEKNYHFNISHSYDYVAITLHNLPIGIDIEKIQNLEYEELSQFFHPEERKYILKDNSLHRFFKLWTFKESFHKNIGTGFSNGLNTLNFNENKLIYGTPFEFQGKMFYFEFINLPKGYMTCICKQTSAASIVEKVSIKDIKYIVERIF